VGERWVCQACYQKPAVCAFGERHAEQRNQARDGAMRPADDAMGADTCGIRAKYSDLLLQHDVAVRQAADIAEENRRLRCQLELTEKQKANLQNMLTKARKRFKILEDAVPARFGGRYGGDALETLRKAA